ncbi:GGDEF domain-containing protein [Tistrella mobilis]|uniref:GGDEF domain-containing protein n=1 Tax=Tistrella mobilis TaxID=171437 RepID=UPI003558CA2B
MQIRAGSWTHKLSSMSVFRQVTLMICVAVVGADLLTAFFYWYFEFDRLPLDILLTTIIVLIVGYPLGFFFIGQNVKLREMALELDRLSKIDDLTGLFNRRTFFAEARRLVAEQVASRDQGAILFIDVDHFKSVNDDFGHATGDAVLRELGAIIRTVVGEAGIAARLGGEEFAVLLHGAEGRRADEIAERVRRGVANCARVIPGLERSAVTVSIGIASIRAGHDFEDALLRADRSLYTAKESGRDRVVREDETAAYG